jgi:hypothetical protein
LAFTPAKISLAAIVIISASDASRSRAQIGASESSPG